ncbi:MAG: Spy/CpxP family protein refolding chaperone [Smithella sp.]
MKKILLSILLMVVFAMPAFSQMRDMPMNVQGGRCGCGYGSMQKDNIGMMGCHMMCIEQLGLTDDQLKKIKPLHMEMQKKLIRSKADLKLAEIDLMEIMSVKDFDMDKAAATVKKIENIRTEQHLDMLRTMKNIRAILTNEQFKNMHRMCMNPVGPVMLNKSKPATKKKNPR